MEEQTSFASPKQDLVADWISLVVIISGTVFLAGVLGKRVLSEATGNSLLGWIAIWLITVAVNLRLISTFVSRLSTRFDAYGVSQRSLFGRKQIRWKDVIRIQRAQAWVWTITISDRTQSIAVKMTQFRDPQIVINLIQQLTPQISHEEVSSSLKQ
jgi:hypothetical protein